MGGFSAYSKYRHLPWRSHLSWFKQLSQKRSQDVHARLHPRLTNKEVLKMPIQNDNENGGKKIYILCFSVSACITHNKLLKIIQLYRTPTHTQNTQVGITLWFQTDVALFSPIFTSLLCSMKLFTKREARAFDAKVYSIKKNLKKYWLKNAYSKNNKKEQAV